MKPLEIAFCVQAVFASTERGSCVAATPLILIVAVVANGFPVTFRINP